MKKPERTPQRIAEEIKKVLAHCADTGMACHRCSYENRCLMVVRGKPIMLDALALIQQLETELAAAKRERDALLNHPSIRNCDHCEYCDDMDEFWAYREPCASCCEFSKFKLIQLCPENTEVQANE